MNKLQKALEYFSYVNSSYRDFYSELCLVTISLAWVCVCLPPDTNFVLKAISSATNNSIVCLLFCGTTVIFQRETILFFMAAVHVPLAFGSAAGVGM